MTMFLVTAALLSLVAVVLVAWPLWRGHAGAHSRGLAAGLGVLVPLLAAMIYLRASNHDWSAATVPPAAGMPSIGPAIAGLEARLAANPEDPAGWFLLGNSYLATGRPRDAVTALERAVGLMPGDDAAEEAELSLAEARILTGDPDMALEAERTIDRILAATPDHPRALWYGGVLALSRGDEALARARWVPLLALSPPEDIRAFVVDRLAEMSGESAVPAP